MKYYFAEIFLILFKRIGIYANDIKQIKILVEVCTMVITMTKCKKMSIVVFIQRKFPNIWTKGSLTFGKLPTVSHGALFKVCESYGCDENSIKLVKLILKQYFSKSKSR